MPTATKLGAGPLHMKDNITPTNKQAPAQHPLFDLAFRPFFMGGAAVALFSMAAWLLLLNGQLNLSLTLSPNIWHAHEMLFGFTAAIAVGFILTAVQTWTGQRSIHGKALILLCLYWLLARIFLISNFPGSLVLAIALQGLWWLAAISAFWRIVAGADNKRNYLFIPLLCTLAALNLSVLIAAATENTAMALHLARTSILQYGLLISVVGGRVIPFFTERGANTKIPSTPKLNKLLPIVSLMGILAFFSSYWLPLALTPAIIMMATGALHLCRLSHWKPLSTLRIPLLWSLHLSYAALSIGLLTLGASYLSSAIRFGDSLHIITIGAIGLMIVAMMSRVSLGHTGRTLTTTHSINLAFALLAIATLVRFIFAFFNQHLIAWNISGSLWMLAFALFLWRYIPILFSSRQ